MSYLGKVSRGQKWYSMRDQDSILPKDILNDNNKMIDVNFYLDEKKKREELTNTKSKGKK